MKRMMVMVALVALTGACKKGGATSGFPGTEAGAKQLMQKLLTADLETRKKLTLAMKPSSKDYEAVFKDAATAKKAEAAYEKLWAMVKDKPISPNEGQTELLMWSAKTDDMKAGKKDALYNFPGGYKRAAANLKDGLTVYRWKFVKPGKTLGMAFDGLYHVNGHWVFMPKPWRALR